MNPFRVFEKHLERFVDKKCINLLEKLWNQKHRHYHNINHLEKMIKAIEHNIWFSDLSVFEKDALLLGAFFHDAIYDPKKKDNEDQSINLVKSYIKNVELARIVISLVETTKYRKRPTNKLHRIFWDADNESFIKGFSELLKNEKLIRKENFFVSNSIYKEKRINFLQTCLGLFDSESDKNILKLIHWVKNSY